MDAQEEVENRDNQPQVTTREKETPSLDADGKSKPAKVRGDHRAQLAVVSR